MGLRASSSFCLPASAHLSPRGKRTTTSATKRSNIGIGMYGVSQGSNASVGHPDAEYCQDISLDVLEARRLEMHRSVMLRLDFGVLQTLQTQCRDLYLAGPYLAASPQAPAESGTAPSSPKGPGPGTQNSNEIQWKKGRYEVSTNAV